MYGSSGVCTLCSVLAGNLCKVFSLRPVLVTMFLCSTRKHLEMQQVLVKMYQQCIWDNGKRLSGHLVHNVVALLADYVIIMKQFKLLL